MASTSWNTMTRFAPRSWLLTTGEIVQEPKLEQTASGRRVRVAGTTDSVYASGLEDMLKQAAQKVADSKGASILFETTERYADLEISALGMNLGHVKADLHLVHDSSNAHGVTIAWWRFKHPTMPIQATVTAHLRTKATGMSPMGQEGEVRFAMPMVTLGGDTRAVVSKSPNLNEVYYQLDGDFEYRWREYHRDHPPTSWDVNHLGTTSYPNPRKAVEGFIKTVRHFNELDEIEVPFFGSPTPEYMTLELYETNVKDSLVDDMKEYLDGAPSAERALELYTELMQVLRSTGLVIDQKQSNDFLAALGAGAEASIGMVVRNPAEVDNRIDPDHKVSIHIPSGTFVVECSHSDVDQKQVVEEWESAKTIAALTGEEPELLAYARAYAKEHSATRTKKILDERGA